MKDDMGREWDMRLDPPAAVQKAMHDTVRRMRLQQLGKIFPTLIPSAADDSDCLERNQPSSTSQPARMHPATSCHSNAAEEDKPCNATILIDIGLEAASLAKGRVASHSACKNWEHKHRAALTSAMNGGQWTQCRRAAVPAWGITDRMCQLCNKELGTAAHRHACEATTPAEGWFEPPENVTKLRGKLSDERRMLLDTRGLFTLRVKKPRRPEYDSFRWLSHPPDVTDPSLRWYVDGSLVNGTVPTLATTGFAIVVTDAHSNLIAWGLGTPPHWITDAAGAEAWALALALKLCPTAPAIVTDCKGLLSEAAAAATNCSAKKKLARTWSHIRGACDGDTAKLRRDRRLDWMPAHASARNATALQKASGKKVSVVDWRANNLADHLARMAAEEFAPPKATIRLAKDAIEMVKCAAAKLGLVTWAANNHDTLQLQADGTTKTVTKRDACEAPVRKKAPKRATASKAEQHSEPADIALTAPKPVNTVAKHRSILSRAANKRMARTEERRRQEDAFAEAIKSVAGCPPPSVARKTKAQKRSCTAGRAPSSKGSSNYACTSAPGVSGSCQAAYRPHTTQAQPQSLKQQPMPSVPAAASTTCPASDVLSTTRNCSQASPATQPATESTQYSHVQEFFNHSSPSVPGLATASTAAEGLTDELLELALLEHDGFAVVWPREAPLHQLLLVRAHVQKMAT